jgi:hypothetical protein
MVPASLLSFVLIVLYIFMKISVNLDLPEGKRSSWWSRRDYGAVRRTYAGQNPDSILPDLSRGGSYLVFVLSIAMAVARFWPG